MSRSYLHMVDRVAIFLLILISTVFQAVLYIDMVKREDGRRGGGLTSAEAARAIETKPIRMKDINDFLHNIRPTKTVSAGDKVLRLSVLSSQSLVTVAVNSKLLYSSSARGIHVCVISQFTGSLMASDVFDMYSSKNSNELMIRFLRSITHPNRVIVMAICDEGTFNVDDVLREEVRRHGSLLFYKLSWRSMWAMACTNLTALAEMKEDSAENAQGAWAEPVQMEVDLVGEKRADAGQEPGCAKWGGSAAGDRRAEFCMRFEGYGGLCDCRKDAAEEDEFNPDKLIPLENSQLNEVPVVIMAGNRPKYLFRLMLSLLNATGFTPSRTFMYINGFFDEPPAVARLFGIDADNVRHVSRVGVGNGVIGNLYRNAIADVFRRNEDAEYLIILEEDLTVSPDIFRYFSKTLHLLESDESIFSISAWNDLGYPEKYVNTSLPFSLAAYESGHFVWQREVARDPSRILRIEGVPGLGWVLKRSLFEKEILPQWPNMNMVYDWDIWLRMKHMLRGRESLIPEVPRTKHIGVRGSNVGPFMQSVYFQRMTHNLDRDVQYKDLDNLTQVAYEYKMRSELQSAVTMVAGKGAKPCGQDFLRGNNNKKGQNRDRVFFIEMKSKDDRHNWLEIAKCNRLWDLDVRGSHKGVWTLGSGDNNTRLFIVGVPYSEYSKVKAPDVVPFTFPRVGGDSKEQKKMKDKKKEDERRRRETDAKVQVQP